MTSAGPTTTLVLGPSLGASVAACWGLVVALLADDIDVVAVELPGHGADTSEIRGPLTVADLAGRALDAVDGPFVYAGDSIGGQVGLQLLLDAPERVLGAVLCCTGAHIGTAGSWADRIAQVEAGGTASLVAATADRWFAPGFLQRHPDRASALLDALRDTDPRGYVALCHALAGFDVRDRLDEIDAPLVAVAGAHDATCPPDSLREIAHGVRHGRLVVLDDVAHQAPAEAPEVVAAIIRELVDQISQDRTETT